VNYPNDFEYTRVTEFKYLTGQAHEGTSVVREFPKAEGEPFYPIPLRENRAQYRQYQALAETCSAVTFITTLSPDPDQWRMTHTGRRVRNSVPPPSGCTKKRCSTPRCCTLRQPLQL